MRRMVKDSTTPAGAHDISERAYGIVNAAAGNDRRCRTPREQLFPRLLRACTLYPLVAVMAPRTHARIDADCACSAPFRCVLKPSACRHS
eukprot:1744904-Pleurochrysis_carterae.AAC.2